MFIFRKFIALIDGAIIFLISWRMKIALKIEKEKRKTGLRISFPEVEKKRIESVRKIAGRKGVSPSLAEEIFKSIIKESVRIQEEQRKSAS